MELILEHLNKILIIVFLILSGLFIRTSLLVIGQTWVRAYHHTGTFLLLPAIAYVISTIIAGNIALSLGMIGALSIVRFRNPVKSPFELVLFFGLLTLGITASVSPLWSSLLLSVIIAVIFGIEIIQKICMKFNVTFYSLSFNEGIELNILEIDSSESILILEENPNLKSKLYIKEENTFYYKFGFQDKKSLDELVKTIDKLDNVKRIDIEYIN